MSTQPPLRWAILGTGKISNDFVLAVTKGLPEDEHKFVAVGDQSLEVAKEFASEFNIPHCFGSYENLLQFSDFDIVYIGTGGPSHVQYVKDALLAGKHVLCEGPMGMNSSEVKEMVSLAREKSLFLMEASWSRFLPVYHRLRQDLKEKIIGDVKQVQVKFGLGQQNGFLRRFIDPNTGDGDFLQMAYHTIELASLIFGGQRPTKVIYTVELTGNKMVLHYPDGKMAQLFASTTETDCPAYIYGTKGWIKMPNFFTYPSSLDYSYGREFNVPSLSSDPNLPCKDMIGLCYQARAIRLCILHGNSFGIIGQTECLLMPLDQSEIIAEIEDEVRKQIGLRSEMNAGLNAAVLAGGGHENPMLEIVCSKA